MREEILLEGWYKSLIRVGPCYRQFMLGLVPIQGSLTEVRSETDLWGCQKLTPLIMIFHFPRESDDQRSKVRQTFNAL